MIGKELISLHIAMYPLQQMCVKSLRVYFVFIHTHFNFLEALWISFFFSIGLILYFSFLLFFTSFLFIQIVKELDAKQQRNQFSRRIASRVASVIAAESKLAGLGLRLDAEEPIFFTDVSINAHTHSSALVGGAGVAVHEGSFPTEEKKTDVGAKHVLGEQQTATGSRKGEDGKKGQVDTVLVDLIDADCMEMIKSGSFQVTVMKTGAWPRALQANMKDVTGPSSAGAAGAGAGAAMLKPVHTWLSFPAPLNRFIDGFEKAVKDSNAVEKAKQGKQKKETASSSSSSPSSSFSPFSSSPFSSSSSSSSSSSASVPLASSSSSPTLIAPTADATLSWSSHGSGVVRWHVEDPEGRSDDKNCGLEDGKKKNKTGSVDLVLSTVQLCVLSLFNSLPNSTSASSSSSSSMRKLSLRFIIDSLKACRADVLDALLSLTALAHPVLVLHETVSGAGELAMRSTQTHTHTHSQSADADSQTLFAVNMQWGLQTIHAANAGKRSQNHKPVVPQVIMRRVSAEGPLLSSPFDSDTTLSGRSPSSVLHAQVSKQGTEWYFAKLDAAVLRTLKADPTKVLQQYLDAYACGMCTCMCVFEYVFISYCIYVCECVCSALSMYV